MTLVQIDLRRDRARPGAGTDAAEGDHAGRSGARPNPGEAVHPDSSDPADPEAPADATAFGGMALGGGLVLLAPLATIAVGSRSALVVLLAGLVALGMIAALVRASPTGVDAP